MTVFGLSLVTVIVWSVVIVILLVLLFSTFKIIRQGTVGVVSWFGSYRRLMRPGLNFKVPIAESIDKMVTTQNQSLEINFQAITQDQANVKFATMLLYAVLDDTEETIKKVAYKFVNTDAFTTALVRTIEGGIRSLVATKKQAEILSLRQEIATYVKTHFDEVLQEWGYHLIDVQVNDIAFASEVTQSMERVVSAQNEKIAAENLGEAQKIRATKNAEADAAAIKIKAQGMADSRAILNNSLKELSPEVLNMMLMDSYLDALKQIAANSGNGSIVYADPSGNGFNTLLANMNQLAGKK